MRKKTAAAMLTVGLLAGGGAALVVPGAATAADSSTGSSATDRAASRLTGIKDALKGLVTDGTLTQAQVDKVATTLSQADLGGPGGPGGHGGGKGGHVSPDAIAKVIGITADQLRTAQQAGQTLTQIAAAHNVSRADLIAGLVSAEKAQLSADVKAGKLTQAQADQRNTDLTSRITAQVDQADGFGRGGHRHGNSEGPASTPTPSASAS